MVEYKKIKEIEVGEYTIIIYSKYDISFWYDEEVVKIYSMLNYKDEKIMENFESVRKPKRIKLFGRKFGATWEEKCQYIISSEIEDYQEEIKKIEHRKKMTEGLLISIKE